MAVIHITKENYESEVVKSEKPVLLDFGAPWCIPCKAVAKVVEELSGERDDIKFAKTDIEESPDIAVPLGIMSIPAIVIFKGGKVADKISGVLSKKALLKKLAKLGL